MQPARFLLEIQRRLPSSDLPGLVSAFLRQPLVWKGLLSGDIGEKFCDRIEKKGSTNLILTIISTSFENVDGIEEIIQHPELPLPVLLQNEAFSLFEETVTRKQSPVSLKDAALLAIALREKSQIAGNWEELIKELNLDAEDESACKIWQTPLSFAYAIVPDRNSLIQALLNLGNNPGNLALISQILLCNHLNIDDQINPFCELLPFLNQTDKGFLLGWLNLSGSVEISAELAKRIQGETELDKTSKPTYNNKLMAIDDIYFRGNLCHLLNDTDQSYVLLCAAREKLRNLLANLDLQAIKLTENNLDAPDMLVEILRNSKEIAQSHDLQTQLAFILEKDARSYEGLESILKASENPLLRIIYSDYLFRNQSISDARQVINQVVEQLPETKFPNPKDIWQYFQIFSHPEGFVEKLSNQNAISEAQEVCSWFLKSFPLDNNLNDTSSYLLEELDEPEDALDYAQISLCLDPEDLEKNKRVANLWGKIGEWDQSFFFWDHIIQTSETKAPEDLMQFARCAFEAGYYTQVLNACEEVFKVFPNDWNATVLTGKALWKLGDISEAISCLTRATILIPEVAEPWIELARIHEASGNSEQALETLKAGISAVPGEGSIYLSLADQYLSLGLVSESLSYLFKASELLPDSSEVALKLGNTLHLLGNLNEANHVFDTARQKWSQDPDLALAHAKVLVRLDETNSALNALDILFQYGTPDIHDYLFFAETITGSKNIYFSRKEVEPGELDEAQKALVKVLEIQPGHYRANLILSEILASKQAYTESFEILQKIINQPEAHLPGNHGRFECGFGLVSLKLGKKEMAIAALKEATQIIPDNVPLLRLFAEANLASDLKEEAIHIARDVYEMESQNIENLLWYADFVLQMNYTDEAEKALKSATRIAPDDPQTWFHLASYFVRTKQLDSIKPVMEVLLSLDNIDIPLFQEIVLFYLSLDDLKSSINCMERIIKQDNGKTSEIYFESACLYKLSGDCKTALRMIQDAIEINPQNKIMQIFKADLLVMMGQNDLAMASLNSAEAISNSEKADIEKALSPEIKKVLPVEWFEMALSPAGTSSRKAYINILEGHLEQAYSEISKAIGIFPDHFTLNLMAAQICLAMLNPVQAIQYLDFLVNLLEKSPDNQMYFLEKGDLISYTLCLSAELALEERDLAKVNRLLCLIPIEFENLARLIALKIRIRIVEGDWKSAEEMVKQLMTMPNLSSGLQPSKTVKSEFGFDLCDHFFENQNWYARTMLDLYRWESALEIFERVCETYSKDPNSWLSLAIAITKAAETQRLCVELKCEKHSPAKQSLELISAQKFTNAINTAASLSNSKQIDRWRARGTVAFHLNEQNIRSFGEAGQFPDDINALMAALRQTGKSSLAIKLMKKLPASALDPVQLGLILLEHDVEMGQELIQQALSEKPGDPIKLVTQALLAEKSGLSLIVLQALVSALQVWEDEPEWHAWAARTAKLIGAPDEIIHHLQCAFFHDPKNGKYVHELGNEFLAQANGKMAIESLTRATELEPECLQTWIQLADAYQLEGKFDHAIASAEKAHELFKTSAKPLNLLGKLYDVLGNKIMARNCIDDALAIDPENEESIIFHAKLLVGEEQSGKAIEVLEKALEENHASSLPILFARVKMIHQVNGAQAALPLARDIVEKNPDAGEAFGILAEILADCGDLEGAEHYAQKASSLKTPIHGVNLLLGKLKWRTGNLDQAVHYLSAAIQETPSMLDAYLDLGHVYQERRETPQALLVYKQAMQIAPKDYRPFYSAAILSREMKDYVEAETMLRKAAELAPEDVNIRRQLSAVIALNLVHNTQEVSYYL